MHQVSRIIVLALSVVFTAAAHAQVPADTSDKPSSHDGYLKVTNRPGELLALDVASRKFVPREGEGPPITLVGVAHIGDKAFYAQLQELLNAHEMVLFESVKPAGAGKPDGRNEAERIASTTQAVRFLASVAEAHRSQHGAYPSGPAELVAFGGTLDERMKQFINDAMTDAWGRPMQYELREKALSIISFGADAAPGGEDANADIISIELAKADPIKPVQSSSDHGLQSEFARAMGLAFQLDAIDYDRIGWVCSDMAMDELQRAMQASGSDFAPLEGALAGSSLSGRVIRVLLGLVRVMNWMSEGASNDIIKVMLIELLGDEKLAQDAIRQFGQGFEEVIVNQRNQVVIDDLSSVLKTRFKPKTIAVFYGAAHMPDLEARLGDQLGYIRQGEPVWHAALGVNLATTKLTSEEIRQLRMTLRQSLRQSLRPPPAAGTK